ncbi:MAG TPA: MerR family transcriptional regulator [Polyangiaceae bacterium]|nr:MerR family transcriptional regulator [Polyangiaceae bacterium]
MRSRERGGDSLAGGPGAKPQRGPLGGGGGGSIGGGSADISHLPTKLYFRIGEVASAVGVETHVLRYWETEFRSIRPQKSSRGQRVYSRRDVETLLRVKELLYQRGFTIAGARKQLRDGGIEPREATDPTLRGATRMREALVDIRKEIVSLIDSFEVFANRDPRGTQRP